MPLQLEKRRRMALMIIALVHECDTGMRIGVTYYRNAVAEKTRIEAFAPSNQEEIDGKAAALIEVQEDIIGLLKRAARLPYRVEARVQAMVTKHGVAMVNAALALVSTDMISDLQTELTPLKTYSDGLKDAYQAGATLEEIAIDIETNAADIDHDESAPIPSGYVDDM